MNIFLKKLQEQEPKALSTDIGKCLWHIVFLAQSTSNSFTFRYFKILKARAFMFPQIKTLNI
jgi:hypothetical protein